MNKPFKNLDEQISILKSRGLHFDCEEEAKRYLLYNNYYNVVNYYAKFFESSSDRFIKGVTFDEIKALHNFDKEIKALFFRYSLDIEKNLKALIAYFYAEEFQEKYAYLNLQNYDITTQLKESIECLSSLSRIIIQESQRKNNAISHYAKNHDDVPIWVIITKMSFGQTNNLFKTMPLKIKNRIIKQFCDDFFISSKIKIKINAKEAWQILCNIQEIRNVAGHNNRLLGYKCRNSLPYNKNLGFPAGTENQTRQSIFDTYLYMKIFLTPHQFEDLTFAIQKNLNSLENKLQSISIEKIKNELGFPKNWNVV